MEENAVSMEDNQIISREDLRAKINELIQLVSNQSFALTANNADSVLNNALSRIKIWSWNTMNSVTWRKLTSIGYIDRKFILSESDMLYNVDLSPNSLLNRYNVNPNDPVLIHIKNNFGGLRIEGGRFYSNSAACTRAENPSWYMKEGTVIDRPEGYHNYYVGPGDPEAIIGGKKLRDLLLLNEEGSHPAYIHEFFNNADYSLNIEDWTFPASGEIEEDSKMNTIFRRLLQIFSNIRKITIQKKLLYKGKHDPSDYYINQGPKIEFPIYIKNLKNVTSSNAGVSNFNKDQAMIDNNDIFNKLNEIYEIWKNLPKTELELKYCHDRCHAAHHTK